MSERSEARLGTEPVGRLMASLAIPSVLAQLVTLLYSIVDRIYIGHIPENGALALTGLGLCTPIILIVSAFAAFAGQGGAPLAAMELGRGDREKARGILSGACSLIVFFSVILTVLLLIVKRPMLRFFGASDATIGFADDYITIYLIGTLFVQTALGLNTYISCQGQAKTAMLSVIIGAAANIALDPLFIFAFKMGVRGAALATIISQFISAAWVVRFLVSERSVIRISPREIRPDLRVVGRIASLGVSPFIIQATESIIAIVFTSGLQKYGGDMYVGSYTILQSVMQLFVVPLQGFSFGVQPIMSYNYGAGSFGRVRKAFRIEAVVCFSYAVVFYLCVLLFPRAIAGIFTSNGQLLALSAEKLPVFLAGMLIFSLQMCCQSVFIGTGQARISLFIACLRKIILLTPLALTLPLFLGVDGVYLAEPVSDTLCAVICIVIFIFFTRKKLRDA